MMNKTISIKEYADLKGVSVQAVYKRLNTSLKPFVVMVEGKKRLDISSMRDLDKQPLNEELNEVKQPTFKVEEKVEDNTSKIIDVLNNELEIKNKQIELLQNQLIEKDKIMLEKDKVIQEQSARVIDLLEQANQLQLNSQILLGQTKVVDTAPSDEEDLTINKTNDTPEEKRTLFGMFRKR